MKRLLIALILVIFASPAFAVTLAWDNDTSWTAAGVVGIRIYWENSVTGETKYAEIPYPGSSMATIADTNFTKAINYDFWATAYNTAQESLPSNVVTSKLGWDGIWGSSGGTAPRPNAPPLFRLSPTPGGYQVPTSGIKTAP